MAEKCPEDMVAGLRPFIQEAHAVVGQRHLARHGDVSAGNQPYIRDGMMQGVTQCQRLSRSIRS
jgi:hypothetical protein